MNFQLWYMRILSKRSNINNNRTLIRPPAVKSKFVHRRKKSFLFFRWACQRILLPVGSDSDFISKRVPGIRSCTKHLSRFYYLRHPDLGGLQAQSDELGKDQLWVSGSCNLLAGLRSRNIAVPSCRPSQRSGWWNHPQLDAGSVEGQNLHNEPKGTL